MNKAKEKKQTGKYGLKGSRLAELLRVIKYFKQFDPKERLENCMDGLELSEFVQRYNMVSKRNKGQSDIEEEFLDVLGKKFNKHSFVRTILSSLEKMNAVYGDRAKQAMENKGVDWKAISHAFRCCFQLKELAENHTIKFPLSEDKFLVGIKNGDYEYSELGDVLYTLMEEAKQEIENSSLPENCDRDFWDKFIIKTYLKDGHTIR
ncbi:MAG: hypothetical protein KDD29_09980 [Flavobacteriales bacterium]|nr:hypothetical protein [Flavobacteriales bacterium]